MLLWTLRATSIVAVSVVLWIVAFLVRGAAPALLGVGPWRFLTDDGWHPTSSPGSYGLLPMIVASLATTAGATLLAGPIGILAALFCRFHAPSALVRPFRALVQLSAGIPSVVYGFWGLTTLVPLVRRVEPPGPSLCAGVLVLAMMIVPTVTLLSLAAVERAPEEELRGASALGLSRWATQRAVVLPAAGHGLWAAVLLGALRAIGETMAVLMVCGNVVRMPDGLFDPVRTLTANIALELGYATAEHRSILFVSGLALLALVALFVWLERRIAPGAARA